MEIGEQINQAIHAAGIVPWLAAIFGILMVLAFGLAFTQILVNRVFPEPKPVTYADMCSFQQIGTDQMTIHCRKKRMVRIWALTGMDHDNLSESARMQAFESRARTLTTLSRQRPAPIVRFFSFREESRTSIDDRSGFTVPKNPEWPVSGLVRERWLEQFRENPVFHNRHYVMVDLPRSKPGYKSLRECSGVIKSGLDEYNPVMLTAGSRGQHVLEPLARLLSPATKTIPRGSPNGYLPDLLCTDHLENLGRGLWRFSTRDEEWYMSVMGIRRLPDVLREQAMLALAGISAKCTILHTLRPVSTALAKQDLTLKKRRMEGTASKASSFAQLEEVAEYLQGGHASGKTSRLHDYSTAVYVYGRTREELDLAMQEVYQVLFQADIAPVTEGIAAESCWWQAQPGYNLYPRAYRFLSEQAAALILPGKHPLGTELLRLDPGSLDVRPNPAEQPLRVPVPSQPRQGGSGAYRDHRPHRSGQDHPGLHDRSPCPRHSRGLGADVRPQSGLRGLCEMLRRNLSELRGGRGRCPAGSVESPADGGHSRQPEFHEAVAHRPDPES